MSIYDSDSADKSNVDSTISLPTNLPRFFRELAEKIEQNKCTDNEQQRILRFVSSYYFDQNPPQTLEMDYFTVGWFVWDTIHKNKTSEPKLSNNEK